jgi:hypothetical protein
MKSSVHIARKCLHTVYIPTAYQKVIWWNTLDLRRLNTRQFGYLKNKALQEARRMVDNYAAIHMPGEPGSITINE